MYLYEEYFINVLAILLAPFLIQLGLRKMSKMKPKSNLKTGAVFPAVNSAASEIRLIVLQPGPSGSSIVCNYKVITLDDPECSYEALSYAWGDPDTRHRDVVLVDGREVRVTASLSAALRMLRREGDERHLWIDAICINQDDDEEKTEQVNMMRRIYRSCSQCDIWLGPLDGVAASDAEAAVEALSWIAGEAPEPGWAGDGARRGGAAAALKTMMGRPWWGRIWTVQEAVLPPRAVVHWGHCRVPWQTMDRASESFFDGSAPGRRGAAAAALDAARGVTDLLSQFRGLRLSAGERPLDLLHRWRFRWATDPRDKVYGLMGIRQDMSLPSVRSCDYAVDVQTLYARVTADLIRDCGDLEPLIGRRGEQQVVEGLPSWAIDWTRSTDGGKWRQDYWMYLDLYSSGRLGYTADRGVYGVGDGLKMLDERTLCLQGRFVDSIAVVERAQDALGELDTTSDLNLLFSGSDRWGRLISRYQEAFPGRLPRDWIRSLLGVITGRLLEEDAEHGEEVARWAVNMVQREALFITEDGRVGLGPWDIAPGQQVWIVGGSRWPFVLTSESTSPHAAAHTRDLAFVGECFVYGIMKGDAPGINVEFRLR